MLMKRKIVCSLLNRGFVAATTAAMVASCAPPAAAIWPLQDGDGNNIVVQVQAIQNNNGEQAEEVTVGIARPKLWLGIQLKDIEGDLATFLGGEDGIFVMSVLDDSPAEEAGLRAGDVVLAMNDKTISELPQLLERLAELDDEKDQKVSLKVLRRGEELTVEVTPKERPKQFEIGNSEGAVFEIDANTSSDDLLELLGQGGNKKLNLIRIGTPSMLNGSKNLIVSAKKSVDGKELEVQVKREGESPMQVTVKEGGEVSEFSGDELEQMPENLREIVDPLIEKLEKMETEGKAKGRIMAFTTDALHEQLLNSEEIRERARAAAAEAVEQSREAQERAREVMKTWRERAAGNLPKEVEELRELVEELQEEVKSLRKQLNDK